MVTCYWTVMVKVDQSSVVGINYSVSIRWEYLNHPHAGLGQDCMIPWPVDSPISPWSFLRTPNKWCNSRSSESINVTIAVLVAAAITTISSWLNGPCEVFHAIPLGNDWNKVSAPYSRAFSTPMLSVQSMEHPETYTTYCTVYDGKPTNPNFVGI